MTHNSALALFNPAAVLDTVLGKDVPRLVG
jgi:hypothetical protein